MQVEINKNEAWKILDAIKAYEKNYATTASVTKILSNIEKKMKQVTNDG
jgi:hypothetical protein